jgi:DNA-binding HxlR family transcriptional regulator
MLGRTYDDENCSAARALEVAGDRWSLLILRDAIFRGMTRFSDFQRSLNIASNVLAARLERFVADGLVELHPRPEHPEQSEYRLTQKGLEFHDVVVALTAWGDKWNAPSGPPIRYRHYSCTGSVVVELRCTDCGDTVKPGEVMAEAGPGSRSPERAQPRAAQR